VPNAGSVALSVPPGNLRGNAGNGAVLYATFCSSCHGLGGKGDGPVAASLNPPPANHTDPVFMSTLNDGHLYNVIQKGGAAIGKSPLMAPWGGVLNEEQTKDLVAHLRNLSGT
jgi:mono/diheme cytochrome c family protein